MNPQIITLYGLIALLIFNNLFFLYYLVQAQSKIKDLHTRLKDVELNQIIDYNAKHRGTQ